MALNTTRMPPQRSFGRRSGTSPATTRATISLSAPPTAASAGTARPVQDLVVQPVQDLLPGIAAPVEPTVETQSETPGETPVEVARPPADILPAKSPAENFTAAGLILRGLAVMARNPVTFLALLAAVALTEQVAAYFSVSAGVPAWMILPLLTTLGCMALYAAAFHTAMSSLKGEQVNPDLSLGAIANTSKSAYGVIAVTVAALSLLLILPAVGLAWRWALAAPAAIVEGGDVRARSVTLAAPCRAQIRQLVWLLAGLSLLRGLLMIPLSSQSVLMALAGDWLFPMLLTVLTAVVCAVLYRELTSPGAPAS